ncbi:MAG: complex I NDUFA9 subunit family protein [Hyphomicrobiaceae bacterium]|nr:complex I NDUFA9 subunit family protein [Hyphomicrobiaceae bacterium]MCC0009822.1 complex I NDUFA9 subunit family protein [Hyphomicrobiaceae bacterium]
MNSKLLHGGLATVFGGGGFVGRHTVRELARRGWRIRAAERRPDLAGYLQPMGAVGQIYAVQANLRYPESCRAAVAGAKIVINTVAIMSGSGKQTLQAVNVDGAAAVARAARDAGVERFIHISAIGADTKSNAAYARSKADGEAAVLGEFPEAIIIRPSIVFGPEDEFFNRFAGMARMSPIMPLVGGGSTKFQPVYVGDLARAIANAAEGAGKPGTVYEIGGPDVSTFRDLLDDTQTWAGRERPYFPMPFWLAKLQAILTWPLPNSMRPITVDQVRMLKKDNIVSTKAQEEGRTIEALGVEHPQSAGVIVPQYLERFKPRGQFANYRS